jgi:hypothetical protein
MPKFKYTDDDLIADALEYSSKGEWQKKSSKYYSSAYARDLIDICCKHMAPLVIEKWTLDVCKAKARQYKVSKVWKENCPGSYSKASSKNWLPICYAHAQDA